MAKKTEKPPAVSAPEWMVGGARGFLPEIKPGESDDAPDGLPAEKCTVQRVNADGTVVVLIDGEDEPTQVALADLEELPAEVPADAAKEDAAMLEQAAFVDPEPTDPPERTDRGREIARLERQVQAAEGAAKRATAKFMNLTRKLEELRGAK